MSGWLIKWLTVGWMADTLKAKRLKMSGKSWSPILKSKTQIDISNAEDEFNHSFLFPYHKTFKKMWTD